ncbi:dual specificity protein phosphatase 13A isoform X2 [Ascaphus truei]|uniref:dual specificity protein phosphatase 13A isoform X2 n=1 Tax=Ascaphus truei TaxID=8439 RepID=UPI003F5A28FA
MNHKDEEQELGVLSNLCCCTGCVTANNRYELWKLGITHVLNAAHGRRFSEGNADFHGASVTYHGVAANDVPDFDMSQYFYSASEFIHQALSITGGRLLVHCVVEISRSATLVLAYLMIHQHLSLTQAVRRVQEKRWVSPNAGFLRQLLRLEEQLRQARGQQGQSTGRGATEQSPAAGEDITLQ